MKTPAIRSSPLAVLLLVTAVVPAVPQISGPSGSAPKPGTLFLAPERVPLEDGTMVEAERGTLYVPVNRSDTTAGVISIEIWRFPAQRPSDLPPVFRLPGGPGFDGLEDDIDLGFYRQVILPYTQVQDYVVVSQRGIGPSKPTTLCRLDVPGGPGEFARRCRAVWEAKGLDLDGFTVIEAAADVADAARAMGYDRIALRGGSFGSHWGLTVMKYHPELVAWALFSGVEGPDHTYDSPTGLLNGLRNVAAAAERSAALRGVIPEEGLIGALAAVRRRLSASPVTVAVPAPGGGEDRTVTFTAQDVRDWALGYTAWVGSREGAASWPADVLRLYYGDFTAWADRIVRQEQRAAQDDEPDYFTAAADLLDCSSGISEARLARLRDDPARALVPEDYSWYEEICAPWEVDAGDAFRRNVPMEIPTVLVHGTWDFNTPYDNALELEPYLRRGKLVTVVGGSHSALGEAMATDSAFADAFWRFFRSGDVSVFPDSVVLPDVDWLVPEGLRQRALRGGDEPPRR